MSTAVTDRGGSPVGARVSGLDAGGCCWLLRLTGELPVGPGVQRCGRLTRRCAASGSFARHAVTVAVQSGSVPGLAPLEWCDTCRPGSGAIGVVRGRRTHRRGRRCRGRSRGRRCGSGRHGCARGHVADEGRGPVGGDRMLGDRQLHLTGADQGYGCHGRRGSAPGRRSTSNPESRLDRPRQPSRPTTRRGQRAQAGVCGPVSRFLGC